MLIVGLTGGIGSGKTTVSKLFSELGVTIIDTDVIAHQLINDDSSVLNEIVKMFGKQVLTQNGALDRKKLAELVFNDKQQKQHLENSLHPRIRSQVNEEVQKLRSSKLPPDYVIVVIPLLFETDFNDITDRNIVVMSDEEIRIQRILQRDQRGMDEIQSIINSQVSDLVRRKNADDIIENNNYIKDIEPQVLRLHKSYSRT